MRALVLWLVFLVGFAGVAAADPATFASVGAGSGINLPCACDPTCGYASLSINYDGSLENAYCWQYGGVVPPTYGAFAERFDLFGAACGVELALTGLGNPCGTLDAYIWNDAVGSREP